MKKSVLLFSMLFWIFFSAMIFAGTYTVTNLIDAGPGSLRQAILDANSNFGADTIVFSIAGKISPTSALPALSDTTGGTIIFAGTLHNVEIDGTSAGANNCFTITTSDNVISGLVINRFEKNGIVINGTSASGNLIANNYVGTDITGTSPGFGNTDNGIVIENGAHSNTIGGTIAGMGNLTSGNGRHGIWLYSGVSSDTTCYNLIAGNYVGTDVNGIADLGNGLFGILLETNVQYNTIGGTVAAARNLVSGNDHIGIGLWGSGVENNRVLGNYVGTDVNGTSALGNMYNGIELGMNTKYNTIGSSISTGRNIISGNNENGIWIYLCSDNVVIGNYIGTDASGGNSVPNTLNGILLDIRASSNIIGGTGSGEGNVISGNSQSGICIDGSTPTVENNQILGNYIGTNAVGTGDLGNTLNGIFITGGAKSNIIGGTITGMRNIISGNDWEGILITDSGTDNNSVLGNYIGTDVSGTLDLGNAQNGIYIHSGAQYNAIGGTTAGAGNLISGNDLGGVVIGSSGSDNNYIIDNYIGTDVNGTNPLANNNNGVLIGNQASSNLVQGNLLSANGDRGVWIKDSETQHNLIIGNLIGTNINGTANLGNASDGILFSTGTSSNTVGGTIASERNIISGNFVGIRIAGSGTDNNIVMGNYIGTDVTGTLDLGNSDYGVQIHGGAQYNIIGISNIISGNDQAGVRIEDSGTDNNIILGNYIGTDVNGTTDLCNKHGIYLRNGPQYNTIGGTVAGARNIISGNTWEGIMLTGSGVDNNVILGNYIGTDVTGLLPLGNSIDGIGIGNGAKSNIIGGTVSGARNIISGNGSQGIIINDIGTDNNQILGNYIGTNVDGDLDLGNTRHGIYIYGGTQSNTIGGSVASAGNIISGNDQNGILIHGSGTDNNVVLGNYIGLNAAGDADIGNAESGISIEDSAQSNIIGGITSVARNVISGNDINGIYILGSGTDNNQILGNYIGTDETGVFDLGNSFSGVQITNGASSNTIGGTIGESRNIISGNNQYGVYITVAGTDNNEVIGNYIGTDFSGTVSLGNLWDGVGISDGAQSNIIGGISGEARNVISNNNSGIFIRNNGTDNNEVLGNYIGTDVTGSLDLGNLWYGVCIRNGAQSNVIGGTIAGMANIIAYNGDDGVYLLEDNTDNNRISGNSIFSNGGLGIDLGGDGVTPNDINDSDPGPNELLNFPVITDIIQTGVDTYTVNGTAAANIEVELYIVNNSTASVSQDPTGYGEGYEYYTTLNTDGSGNFSSSGITLSPDDILSSLAIDGNGNTSEFGKNKTISSNTVTVTINNDAPASAMQGATDILMSNFTLSTDADNAIWTDIKVEGSGTNIDTDINSIKVYADNGNTTFSSAEDTPIGNGTFTSGISNIDIIDQNIISTTSLYFIVIDLNSDVNIGNTFNISITNTSNFTILTPDTMADFSPFTSGSVNIIDGPDPITVQPTDIAINTTKAGTEDQLFEKLTFSTLNETATISVIKTDLIGTGDDIDVTSVKIYLDNGDDNFSVADDTLIGTGTFTSKTSDIDIADQVIGITSKTYFIALDVSGNAVNGHTIGVSCSDTTYFTVLSPDTVSDTNLPFSSGFTLIKNYADSLNTTKIYPNPWNNDLNSDHITFAQLTENVTIKIYTIAGKLVLESDANGQSEWEWDMTNNGGKNVASGVYICYIFNDKGEKKIFKIAIIR